MSKHKTRMFFTLIVRSVEVTSFTVRPLPEFFGSTCVLSERATCEAQSPKSRKKRNFYFQYFSLLLKSTEFHITAGLWYKQLRIIFGWKSTSTDGECTLMYFCNDIKQSQWQLGFLIILFFYIFTAERTLVDRQIWKLRPRFSGLRQRLFTKKSDSLD